MTIKLHRAKHATILKERLADESHRLKEAAAQLPPGTARELLLRRAWQADIAVHIDKRLTSPGLQPPVTIENLLSNGKGQG
jgi:hypothetical protein